MALRCSAPASSNSVRAPPAHLFFPMGLPGSSISATAPPLVATPLFARAPPLATAPQPATNLIRRRRSPVWLAIWRTWAGFANSQLLHDAAALSSMQGLQRSGNSSSQTSASLHPPAALRLRCLPFTSRGTWSSTVCAEEFPTPREMSLNGLPLLRHSKICRPICTDCLRHLRISAG